MRRLNATKNIGDPSSKYGYDRNGEQFNRDMQKHVENGKRLYNEFKDWMKAKEVDPRTFREMFVRYHDEFIK